MSVWTNTDGVLIVNDSGVAIDCEECPCDEEVCSAVGSTAVLQYVADQMFSVRVTISSTDFTHACASGNCTPLIGVFTLPFLSHGASVTWQDDFAGITLCAVTSTLRVRVIASEFGPFGIHFQVDCLQHSRCRAGWEQVFPVDDCDEFLADSYSLDIWKTDSSDNSFQGCKTNPGGGGKSPVILEIIT